VGEPCTRLAQQPADAIPSAIAGPPEWHPAMRAWICTRNDVLGNLAVLLAALGVVGTGSGWPDVIVAAIMFRVTTTIGPQMEEAKLTAIAPPAVEVKLPLPRIPDRRFRRI
jgi:hypothetical protein